MSETPKAKKLPSPQERLDLILLGLARREPATKLCKQAGVSRELFYRWMRAVRQAGLKTLEAKLPGPKKIKAEKAPKEALKLRDRVKRMAEQSQSLRKERDHLKLVVETAQRIIERNAWNQPPEPGSKKNAMPSARQRSSTSPSGSRRKTSARLPASLPGAGESLGARIGDGSTGGGARNANAS